MQSLDDALVEERAVDAYLNLYPGQSLAHGAHTAFDEGVGAVGIMDVSGPMVHVEHLVGLGDGAEQRVVAARALLRLVESHGGAFGMARSAQHRPVEVEGDAREPFGHQALDDHRRRLGADVADAALVGTAERAADGGHVGQSLQAEHALDQLIISVVVEVSQSSMSDDEMHDQQHHHDVVSVDRVGVQVAKASPQPLLDANEGKEVLKENESRIRCQILCLESELHAQRGFTPNLGFAKFHSWSPFHLVRRRLATMIVPISETTSFFLT